METLALITLVAKPPPKIVVGVARRINLIGIRPIQKDFGCWIGTHYVTAHIAVTVNGAEHPALLL